MDDLQTIPTHREINAAPPEKRAELEQIRRDAVNQMNYEDYVKFSAAEREALLNGSPPAPPASATTPPPPLSFHSVDADLERINESVFQLAQDLEKIRNNRDFNDGAKRRQSQESRGNFQGNVNTIAAAAVEKIDALEQQVESRERRELKAYHPPQGSTAEQTFYLKRAEWREHYSDRDALKNIADDYRIAQVDGDLGKMQFIEDFLHQNAKQMIKSGMSDVYNELSKRVESNQKNRITPETKNAREKVKDLQMIARTLQRLTTSLNGNDHLSAAAALFSFQSFASPQNRLTPQMVNSLFK